MSYGKYGTRLKDNSEIIYRKTRGDDGNPGKWTYGIVHDDRIYGIESKITLESKITFPGEIYHVTATNTGCIDFGIGSDGMNSGHREWEVFTPAMDGHPNYGSIDQIKDIITDLTSKNIEYKSSNQLKNSLFDEVTHNGEKELVPKESLKYGMNENNAKVVDTWRTKGTKAAVQSMFINPETGNSMSYSEMRYFYG